ncbi:hypothetical protein F4777DRAFT_520981 [Nemania sp. FL0916]|nr:hypothetical protein F4777DRAFT_520981 [Nemania sp. FL0916]
MNHALPLSKVWLLVFFLYSFPYTNYCHLRPNFQFLVQFIHALLFSFSPRLPLIHCWPSLAHASLILTFISSTLPLRHLLRGGVFAHISYMNFHITGQLPHQSYRTACLDALHTSSRDSESTSAPAKDESEYFPLRFCAAEQHDTMLSSTFSYLRSSPRKLFPRRCDDGVAVWKEGNTTTSCCVSSHAHRKMAIGVGGRPQISVRWRRPDHTTAGSIDIGVKMTSYLQFLFRHQHHPSPRGLLPTKLRCLTRIPDRLFEQLLTTNQSHTNGDPTVSLQPRTGSYEYSTYRAERL